MAHDHTRDAAPAATGHHMPVIFQVSTSTPLFSTAEPSQAIYVGNCILLAFIALTLRSLLAVKPFLENRLWAKRKAQAARAQVGEELQRLNSEEDGAGEAPKPERSLRSREMGPLRTTARSRAMGLLIRAGRAFFEVGIAMLGYLLMLAIMTMNAGYCASVLGGIFLGTFLFGGGIGEEQFDHC
ncbi:hypothetical protein HYQ45_008804 [Verticillium longisporum]|uniref:Copper transport protein n=4 Tax=Verticillium TaxID=1036719 RepID=G2X1A0_VERDV|nr:uncharacterized protein VDAG_04029 [Verticillium dahliae VdLs.17]KAF3344085.1 AB hydrolase superfamily protein ydjP [Verticillium dahliae VDG2]KAF3354633.1 hypothetical protein VdG1_07423 [Verticillium dahliae VDG1]KAG7132908.1 hypothetical protein HYQ45_008804 [Verticillium longisporum]KAH6705022.1 Ctr copper transporter [Verticillium dahliae]EGY22591.1 hypothetical protein VDAG_04029 [Verticillium dahliae VdLs.17]